MPLWQTNPEQVEKRNKEADSYGSSLLERTQSTKAITVRATRAMATYGSAAKV